MSLPPMNGEYLPAASTPHPASLDEVYDRFVVTAPYRDQREPRFQALQLIVTAVTKVFGPTTFFVEGSFVTHEDDAEPTVAVAFMPEDQPKVRTVLQDSMDEVVPLVTLSNVAYESPNGGVITQLRTVGGLVDSFMTSTKTLSHWHTLWSQVKVDGLVVDNGLEKGYVEVRT